MSSLKPPRNVMSVCDTKHPNTVLYNAKDYHWQNINYRYYAVISREVGTIIEFLYALMNLKLFVFNLQCTKLLYKDVTAINDKHMLYYSAYLIGCPKLFSSHVCFNDYRLCVCSLQNAACFNDYVVITQLKRIYTVVFKPITILLR